MTARRKFRGPEFQDLSQTVGLELIPFSIDSVVDGLLEPYY
jgi:hypothetical protein